MQDEVKPFKTREKALKQYHVDLNNVLLCITSAQAQVKPIGTDIYELYIQRRSSDPPGLIMIDKSRELCLELVMQVAVIQEDGGYGISTKLYVFEIWQNNKQLLGWHYHPELNEDDDPIAYPHIHVYSSHRTKEKAWIS